MDAMTLVNYTALEAYRAVCDIQISWIKVDILETPTFCDERNRYLLISCSECAILDMLVAITDLYSRE
jgi:hypothetical protein